MRYGVFLPPFDELADAEWLADLAGHAEAAGWDGVFLWDHIAYRSPVQAVADPWIALAAMAARTERIRIGPMVTPLPRRRPVVMARQTATLDRLSNGRLVLGVGIGGDNSREFSGTGEVVDDRIRGAMLDESLDVLTAAWSGEPVEHHGRHYAVDGLRFLPIPAQQPRPPVWVAGRYGNPTPLRRAARWDGVFPIDLTGPADLAAVVETVRRHRGGALDGYDVVASGPPGTDPAPWREHGATWWLTQFGVCDTDAGQVAAVVRAGPPR